MSSSTRSWKTVGLAGARKASVWYTGRVPEGKLTYYPYSKRKSKYSDAAKVKPTNGIEVGLTFQPASYSSNITCTASFRSEKICLEFLILSPS